MSRALASIADDDIMNWPDDILAGQQRLRDEDGCDIPLVAQTDWKRYSERVGITDPPDGVLVVDMPYQLQHDAEDGFLVGFTAVGWEMSDADDPTVAIRTIDPVILLVLFRNLLRHLRREYIQTFIDVAEGTQWLVPPMMLPMIVATGLSQRYSKDTDMTDPVNGASDILSESSMFISPEEHIDHHQPLRESSVFMF
jgi:hypothetical protein